MLLVYLLSTSGRVHSPDGVVMARTATALVTGGSFAVEDPGYPPGFLARGRDGRSYGKYGPGLPLAAAPLALLGEALAAGLPAPGARFGGLRFLWYDAAAAEAWRFFALALANPLIGAATAALLYLLALDLGARRRTALLVALALAFASPWWVYAKTFFAEPLAGLGLTVAARWALRERRRGSLADWGVAGAGLAVAVLAKPAFLVAGLPFALLAGAAGADGRDRARATAALLAGPLAAAGLVALLQLLRFGAPFAGGYRGEGFTTPFLTGLTGLLVSPGRGLLPYFPAVVAAALLARGAARWRPAVVWLAWGTTATIVALHAPWHGWDGGWSWGPRFLVPALPLLALTLAPALSGAAGRAGTALVGGLLGLSLLITLIGTLVPSTEYHQALRQAVGPGYLEAARWRWEVFPPLAYWYLPKSYWLLPRVLATPAAWGLAAAFGLAAGALVPAARRLVALGRERTPPRWRPADAVAPLAGAALAALVALL